MVFPFLVLPGTVHASPSTSLFTVPLSQIHELLRLIHTAGIMGYDYAEEVKPELDMFLINLIRLRED